MRLYWDERMQAFAIWWTQKPRAIRGGVLCGHGAAWYGYDVAERAIRAEWVPLTRRERGRAIRKIRRLKALLVFEPSPEKGSDAAD